MHMRAAFWVWFDPLPGAFIISGLGICCCWLDLLLALHEPQEHNSISCWIPQTSSIVLHQSCPHHQTWEIAGLHKFSSVNAIGIQVTQYVNSGDDPNRFEGLFSVHCVGSVAYWSRDWSVHLGWLKLFPILKQQMFVFLVLGWQACKVVLGWQAWQGE